MVALAHNGLINAPVHNILQYGVISAPFYVKYKLKLKQWEFSIYQN